MCTTSLNYLNGQNKTVTYLWPFIPSSVTETHILLTCPYPVPKIHEISLSYTAVKKSRWELFTPWRTKQRRPPLNSECLSFGAHGQALYTLCIQGLGGHSGCHSAYSVQYKWQRKERLRIGHLSMSLLIPLSLKSYQQQWYIAMSLHVKVPIYTQDVQRVI